jgi:3',5'-cyclic AMP phosphodiesterase CpdA
MSQLNQNAPDDKQDKENILATFLHISDLHFGGIDTDDGDSLLLHRTPRWDTGNMFDGFLGHHRVALQQLRDIFDALLKEEPNTRLIVTGDLTACGDDSAILNENQFNIAWKFLTADFNFSGISLGLHVQNAFDLCVPGNHDHWPGRSSGRSMEATILGPATAGLRRTFRESPFVHDPIPITLGSGKVLQVMFAGIDTDADVPDHSPDRLLARGDFISQLSKLEQGGLSGRPRADQIRVLLMHHSPMYVSRDGSLMITSKSMLYLNRFVIQRKIAVILTGHIHCPDYNITLVPGSRTVLEARCGSTTARDGLPPGWKVPGSKYVLFQNALLVHRLVESAKDEVSWRTELYNRTPAGFQPARVWPDVKVWP